MKGRRYAGIGGALLLELLGAGGALLVALRTWQVVTSPKPFGQTVIDVSGRTIDGASFALALVALAGLVAVLATRGRLRQAVGGVVALAGIGVIWRSARSAGAVGADRARSLVTDHQKAGIIDAHVVPHVVVHGVWPALSIVCGVLVAGAGALIAARGHRWLGLSARYERAPSAANTEKLDPDAAAAKERATLWNALDRGEDPTQR